MRADNLPLLFYNREAARRTAARMNERRAGGSREFRGRRKSSSTPISKSSSTASLASRRGLGVRRREPSSDRFMWLIVFTAVYIL